MLGVGGVKENPNPTVHTTRGHHPSHVSAGPSLGSSAIRRYHLGSQPPSRSSYDNDVVPPEAYYNALLENHAPSGSISAEDRSVALALSAASYPSARTSGSGNSSTTDSESEPPKLELLQQAGFALFHPRHIQRQCRAIRYPSYSPVAVRQPPLPEKEEIPEHERDAITANEIFDIVRNIQDPEHPLTLEQLNVVRLELIDVHDMKGGGGGECPSQTNGCAPKKFSTVHVQFTPTIPHCSMATLIGLSIRVKLLRSLHPRFKVVVKIESGAHVSERAVNKQLADKERVRAALENDHLLGVVNKCIAGGMEMS